VHWLAARLHRLWLSRRALSDVVASGRGIAGISREDGAPTMTLESQSTDAMSAQLAGDHEPRSKAKAEAPSPRPPRRPPHLADRADLVPGLNRQAP
jgi:hypothetical protein